MNNYAVVSALFDSSTICSSFVFFVNMYLELYYFLAHLQHLGVILLLFCMFYTYSFVVFGEVAH